MAELEILDLSLMAWVTYILRELHRCHLGDVELSCVKSLLPIPF